MQTPNRHSSATNGNNTIHNDTPHPHSDYSDATSPTKPSLLRIGLSAGYVSLCQKKQSSGSTSSPAAKQGYSTTASTASQIINDKPINYEGKEKKSLLSSPTEEASTLAYIQDAQNIISSKAATTLCKNNNNVEEDDDDNNNNDIKSSSNDPIAVAALAAMGGYNSSQQKRVLINVIDPTTPSSSSGAAVAAQQQQQQQQHTVVVPQVPDTPPSNSSGGKGLFGGFGRSTESSSNNNNTNSSHHGGESSTSPDISNLNIYNKLSSTFQTNYNSTLHSLPYVHPRTNTNHVIPSLPNVTFGLTTQPISDPANWHCGPYCHVYIAAVENVDHYRAKVRPALRAFVNQIEGSGMSAIAGSSSSGTNHANNAQGPPGPPSSTTPTTPSTPKGHTSKKSANEKALQKAGLSVGKTIVAGNFGSRYVIVFVPIGNNANNRSGSGSNNNGAANNNAPSGGGGGFGGFRAGRKGQGGGVILSSNSSDVVDDTSSTVTATTMSSSTTQQHHDGSTSSTQHQQQNSAGPIAATKEVKELYNKFLKDFPNGRTVILGSLLDENSNESSSPLKNQEWKAFLHNLGGAIVDGFHDRVRRYDEELRRLDSRRVAFVRKLSSGKTIEEEDGDSTKKLDNKFDLSHFFLVKESLAFTYEQMQLFEEAKLQYEELSAFLPEDAWRRLAQRASLEHEQQEKKGENDDADPLKSSVMTSSSSSSPSDLAMAGDSYNFRHHIKISGKDLHGVSQYVPQYIYAREVHLLFQMGTRSSAVDVLALSKDFIQRAYRSKLLDVGAEYNRRWKEEIEGAGFNSSARDNLTRQDALKKERLGKEAEVEAWALASCWDVKSASGHYFSFNETVASVSNNSPSKGGKQQQQKDSSKAAAASTIEEVQAARCLAELLEFAILRLMRLADLALSKQGEAKEEGTMLVGGERVNPIRRATSERPMDTLKPWEPWRKLQKVRDEMKARQLKKSEKDESWPNVLPLSVGISSWIHSAMENASIYEETYLELAENAVYLNRRAGRFRFASRLEDHRAEVLIARGEYTQAAQVLSSNVGACARDQWTRANYWRIFRLACCQRMSGDVLAYLETLTQSFNPKLSSVAPKKTASLFQQDLESIITHSAVAEPRWGASPFLETELSIESEAAGKSSQPLPFLRRKLTKHICFVGDDLKFSLSVHSHLPRPIAVNGVRLYLITLDRYEFVYRRNGIVTEDDAFRILSIDSPIDILPGQNEFSFSWQPMTFNSYVLATVEIQWKEASFFYDSALLRKPMIGLDIQPSQPTQTIELNPLFLIPGHVQNVRLVFHSGSDVITEGRVRLICSEGLLVVPPKTDPSKLDEAWSDECIIPLDACGPGKKIVITTLVKSSTIKHGDNTDHVQTMWAKVETRYRQESYEAVMEKGEEPESDPMKTLLEAMVTTLDRPALAVNDAEAFLLGDDHVMVNISLQCNSPVPFYIKEWHLDLPTPLLVEEDGDLNKGMFRHAIPEGEMLLLGFKCLRSDSSGKEPRCEKPLLRVVLQDDFGKTFLQVLPVHLEEMYKKLRKEDDYAELYTATAELTCSSEEGAVGHPVPFVYDLNLQSLVTPRQRKRPSLQGNASVSSIYDCPILYTIVSDGCDWIVSGKVQGLIKPSPRSESLSIRFRGIPTKSGILYNFPKLYLEYLPMNNSSDADHLVSPPPPITVQCHNPDSFQSFAYTSSLSLAVPATLEEF